MTDDWNDEYLGSVADDTTAPDPPEWVTVNASQTRIHVFWEGEVEPDSGDSDTQPDWVDEMYIGEDWDEIAIQNAAQGLHASHVDSFLPGNPADVATGLPPIEDQEWVTEEHSFHAPTLIPDLSFHTITAEETQDILGFDYEPDEEIAYYQVQVARDANFQDIIRHDRMVKGHSKTWRIHKPSSATFHARVRSVDILGNKSAWVTSDDYNKFPYQPCRPNVRFKKQDNGNYRVNVNYQNDPSLSPELDEDISRYQFAAREVEWTRSDEALTASETTVTVANYDSDEVPHSFPFTIFVGDEQMSVTNITGANNLAWHVTRGFNGTTATSHPSGTKVYYFGRGTASMIQMIAIDDDGVDNKTAVIWRGLDPNSRWKFRVRAIDAQNRKSFWSPYTPVLKATNTTRYTNEACVGGTGVAGDPAATVIPDDPPDGGTVDDGEDTPTVDTAWPHERIIRFEADVSTGFETDPVTGFDALIQSARVTVDTSPTLLDATVDVNVNGVSVLTVTIPAADPKNQSDLTFVTPPLRIRTEEGLVVTATDEITVTQTDMQDAIGTMTVYLMVYLV